MELPVFLGSKPIIYCNLTIKLKKEKERRPFCILLKFDFKNYLKFSFPMQKLTV